MAFFAAHQDKPPERNRFFGPFDTEEEAKRACDELITIECRQEIVNQETGEFRVRWGTDDRGWSAWRIRPRGTWRFRPGTRRYAPGRSRGLTGDGPSTGA